jgi:hypothetical protein
MDVTHPPLTLFTNWETGVVLSAVSCEIIFENGQPPAVRFWTLAGQYDGVLVFDKTTEENETMANMDEMRRKAEREKQFAPEPNPDFHPKPPLGVMPRWRWLEARVEALAAAISRYTESGPPLMTEQLESVGEWARELSALTDEIKAEREKP